MEIVSINKGVTKTLHAGGPTDLELALYAWLEEQEIEFVREWNVPGTRYRVDAFDPSTCTAYEADGPLHDKERDRQRDAQILATGNVVKMVRFGYRQLRGWL